MEKPSNDLRSVVSTEQGETITRIEVRGMNCSICMDGVQTELTELEGVESVSINVISGTTTVIHKDGDTSAREIIEAIKELGYDASSRCDEDKKLLWMQVEQEKRDARKRFLVSLAFAVPTFILSTVIMIFLPKDNDARLFFASEILHGLSFYNFFMILLTTAFLMVVSAPFYGRAYDSIRFSTAADVDVLIAVGATTTYLISLINIVARMVDKRSKGEPLELFAVTILLITFVLLGEYIEVITKRKTLSAMSKLLELQPDKAILVVERTDDEGNISTLETEVEQAIITAGDILRVNPGARIPCDGHIVKGATSIDESILTGELAPVVKGEGDMVIAATLNLTASIMVKAEKIGAETTLSKMVQQIREASSSPAPIQNIVNRITSIFVPTVVVVAVMDFFVWFILGLLKKIPDTWIPEGETFAMFALSFAISILVIGCPCALTLASSSSVMIGTGMAAKYGVFLKNGGATLELSNQIDVVAFDKTGTLTYGKPSVSDFRLLLKNVGDSTGPSRIFALENMVWGILSKVEAGSDHPLAQAIVKHAINVLNHSSHSRGTHMPDIEVEEVSEVPGRGLQATVSLSTAVYLPFAINKTSKLSVFIGNEAWLAQNNCKYSSLSHAAVARAASQSWQQNGKSVVMVGIGNSFDEDGATILALIAVVDTIRPEAKQVVSELQSRGIDVWMITGDNQVTGKAVADKVGIKNVIAKVLPHEKAEKIRWLQSRGKGFKESTSASKLRFPSVQGDALGEVHRAIVAMVGDGLNDSAALSQADVGIAIGSGTDIAMDSADVILLRSQLQDLLTLLALSRLVINRIRINIFLAIVYNILAIPIAGGLLFPWVGISFPPVLAILLLCISTLSVLISSGLLKLFKPPRIIVEMDQKEASKK
ncbi:heavy metal translocatin [Basidiobolus meristosporus CBS 931.73]|uniref:Heavy metal translocatin n=1 Tax=Basidiobolus meristosporus CBS 931.73 TaxID=1314790 RepID=A0A1Y1XHC4_9FUNG|nr:heavy metal translocatin [Basidiobolus meristosporus CBS 931.73]|eukprot:ORX84784.1 heavy metal translocatin [Basidiobolus meristosporus CBS 931.73]